MTQRLYIPTFIASVIESTPLYMTGYTFLLIAFLILGIINLYIMHGVVLDNLTVNEAGIQSRQLMKKHWKEYWKQNILYSLSTIAIMAVIITLSLVIPLISVYVLELDDGVRRFLTIFISIGGALFSSLSGSLATPFYILKMTQLFYSYKTGNPVLFSDRNERKHRFVIPAICIALLGVIGITLVMNTFFDTIFPLESHVEIIAHRAGGNEGPENTIKGLEAAYQYGAYGCEIDIQRTKDGFYVLNHDNTFKRVAGDNRKPQEMTLEEVKALSVEGEPVPTYEEVLDACRGKLILFTELKGNTADRRMADDAVRMIKAHGMEEECVLISLKYDLVDYIESNYPEMHTGFLTFASFGDTAALHCDYLGLEEESATADAIQAIHDQGKKALVWTANESESQHYFLCSNADGLITDNVKQASQIMQELAERNDLERIVDLILGS